MLDYNSLELVYKVVLDLTKALEQDWASGTMSEQDIEILSGCYSVCDYTANKLAKLACYDNDAQEDLPLKAHQFVDALAIMKECEIELSANLSDDICVSCIDYQKVHALVGFRTLIPHIDRLTEIIKD